ncbi:hypothetical protein CTAYLR_005256 [Chrysophaeum taylorii]|uniref:Bifunctional lysine-specific demethylase and histidyl-hydroxylase n=1 Tax=Chrysophaeum taylorii TaxID=2483200 RepID=A0AAD7UJ35_9STRA|nr:hypothetical protein CTAYLR_005256 [Chrysophaeum taylorii]
MESCTDWSSLFGNFASSAEFRNEYWRRAPVVLREIAPWAEFGLDALRAAVLADPSIAADAARVDFDFEARRGWTNVCVGDGWDGVERALDDGTVVFNTAGLACAPLADACLAALDAFELPVGVNVYITRPGRAASAPPHTDRQDVLVVQVAGHKRWRVHVPPRTDANPLADPFARGKGDDVLDATSLDVIVDDILRPGDVLYVPAGAPHQTATPPGSETSLHLTFGIVAGSTWGLSFDTLRRLALPRVPEDDLAFRLRPRVHRAFHTPLPIGSFLEGTTDAAATFDYIARKYLGQVPDPDAVAAAISRARRHHAAILAAMRTSYDHVAWRGSYLQRVDPYLDALAGLIDDLYAATPSQEKEEKKTKVTVGPRANAPPKDVRERPRRGFAASSRTMKTTTPPPPHEESPPRRRRRRRRRR